MARENQSLQIGLIVSIIVTILLLVTTVIFFRSSQTQYDRAESAEASAQSNQAAAAKSEFQNQALKYMIATGAPTKSEIDEFLANIPNAEDEELKAIREAFEQDMALFGTQYSENRNYQKLPDYLLTTIRDLNQQLSQRDAEVKKLTAEKEHIQKDAAARIQKAQDGLQTALTDLTNERNTFNQDRQRLESEKQALLTQLAEQQKKAEEAAATAAAQQQNLQKSEQQLRQQLTLMKGKVDDLGRGSAFDVADGRITYVSQRGNTVWVNLGSADGLRRQITFSVYGRDVSGVMQKDPKGTIEITQIMGDHLAQATIIEQSNRNIILPGDQIHTPAWRPGRQIRFALAGGFDLDNDGRSDRELIKKLISINNGAVDAEILENGQATGQLSPVTRYLVLGEQPDDLTQWTSIISQAQQYGVEQISVDELLNFMGWRGEVGTVTIGGGSGPVEVREPPAETTTEPPAAVTEEAFQPGQPAAPTADFPF